MISGKLFQIWPLATLLAISAGFLPLLSSGQVTDNPSYSPNTPAIKFSGVWLTGSFQDIETHFPVGRKFTLLFGDTSGAELSRKILSMIRSEAKEGGARLVDCVAPDDFRPEASSGRSYVMACSINYEHVDCLEIGGVFKIMAEVGFDLVICDFSTRSVVVCLPGRVLYTDISPTLEISPGQKEAVLQNVYSQMLPEQFMKICKAHGPEIIGMDAAGVTDVKLFDEALETLPDHLKERHQAYFANVASSNFYEATGLPLLPYSRGSEMVFIAMQENLVDVTTSSINNEEGEGGQKFVLKKPIYEMELIIPAFQTTTATSNAIGRVVQNSAYSRITIKKGSDVIYTSQHDGNVQNTIPRGSSSQTPWLAYSDAVNEMFYGAAKKIKTSMSGKQRNQDSPMLVINPSGVKSMFIDCAPWAIVKN
jgi:hypothetical protein